MKYVILAIFIAFLSLQNVGHGEEWDYSQPYIHTIDTEPNITVKIYICEEHKLLYYKDCPLDKLEQQLSELKAEFDMLKKLVGELHTDEILEIIEKKLEEAK